MLERGEASTYRDEILPCRVLRDHVVQNDNQHLGDSPFLNKLFV